MRKQLFFKAIILCALSASTAFESTQAQTWPMTGAEWRYCITNDLGMPAGYIDFAYTRDTMIEGTTFNVIQAVGGSDNNFHPVYAETMALYTRFSNDSVYRYVLDAEHLYFTFNSQPGDSHLTFRSPGASNDWNTTACSSDLVLETLETSFQNYGGQTLQQWIVEDTLIHYLYEWGLTHPVTYTLVERIGVIDAYPFIFTQEPPAPPGSPCNLPTCSFTVTLGSYADSGFSHEFGECLGTGIDEKNHSNHSLYLYPNPVYDLLYIEIPLYGNTVKFLIITDILGNIVLEKEVSKNMNAVSLKNLPKGIYIVFLHGSDSLPDKYKIIKM
jgi:hypothetical protein